MVVISNVAGLARLVESGGFEVTEGPRRLFIPPGPGQPLAPMHPRLLLSQAGRQALVIARKGDLHAALTARPLPGL